jgi:hypothetical protein
MTSAYSSFHCAVQRPTSAGVVGVFDSTAVTLLTVRDGSAADLNQERTVAALVAGPDLHDTFDVGAQILRSPIVAVAATLVIAETTSSTGSSSTTIDWRTFRRS